MSAEAGTTSALTQQLIEAEDTDKPIDDRPGSDDDNADDSSCEEEWEDTDTTRWPRPWGLVAKHFKQHSEDGETLDIYQMCSFMSKNCDSMYKRYFYYIKAICCSIFQTVGLGVLIYNSMNDSDKTFCEGNGEWDTRTIATIATLYIALTMCGMIQQIDEQGLYEVDGFTMQDIPPFIQAKWLYLGIYINYASLIGAIFGSFMVIYLSESALDVVLNAVALFFVIELDDLMIDDYDYTRIRNFFETTYNPEKYKNYQYQMGKCEKYASKGGSCFFITITIFAVIAAFAAPFWMAICY